MNRSLWLSRRCGWAAACAAACAVALLCGVAAPAAAQPVPVADFFKPPSFSNMQMSPSGKRICATVPRSDGRLSLAVIDLDDMSKSRMVAGFQGADVLAAAWVNDDRLVFNVTDRNEAAAQQRGTGLYAVDAKGEEAPRQLVRPQWLVTSGESSRITSRVLQPNHYLYSLLRDGTNDVIIEELVGSSTGELRNINLKRLDTTNGVVRSISQNAPDGVVRWTLDRTGQPRFVIAKSGELETLYWRPRVDATWAKLAESNIYTKGGVWRPEAVGAGDRVYAVARAGDADNESLLTVDMSGGKPAPQTLLGADGFDFSGTLVFDGAGTLLGVHYVTDAEATHWFDAGMAKIQAQVDALRPGLVNRLDCGLCDRRDQILVTSYSDRQPERYALFDTKAGTIAPIVDSRPWIKRQAMAQRDLVRVAARDGLSLPVHVTRPNGAKGPLPMVVLVHGGPWVRGGVWGWEPQSQFLASRGYVVIEPEFRGSAGFGDKHFRAGWKQWGLAMQDDVADAAAWAVKQGYADPKRICIGGASYGGYATLMGLVRNPELFRCGFEWVGVTDIDLMYTLQWSDMPPSALQFGLPQLVGDRKKDAAQFAATSPLQLADKITQPLLMAYGGIDQRVPIDHGTRFRDAVRKTNKQVEWIVYADEGHQWLLPANHVDFWTRVEGFLDKNLKAAP